MMSNEEILKKITSIEEELVKMKLKLTEEPVVSERELIGKKFHDRLNNMTVTFDSGNINSYYDTDGELLFRVFLDENRIDDSTSGYVFGGSSIPCDECNTILLELYKNRLGLTGFTIS